MAGQITIRVRSSARTSRFLMKESDSLGDLKDKILEDTQISVEMQRLARDPKGVDAVSDNNSATLKSLGFRNGEMLHLLGADVAVRPTSSKGGVVLRRGQLSSAENKEEVRELTRWCQHRPGGACHHCCPGEEGMKPKRCDHAPHAKCPNCVGEETTGEDMEWLCSHPDDQMCSNCMPLDKGEKVELEMLCLHGPDGHCTNCIEDDEEHVTTAAHVSYEEWLAKRRVNCDHATGTVCMHCLPPSKVSYVLDRNCRNHRPYPAGLCNDCQPPTCTLARQKYRHVDYVEFLAFDEFASFAQLWTQTGMTVQRAGLLYGSLVPDANYRHGTKAVVQAVYEPPQEGLDDDVRLLPDPQEASVEKVARALGLTRLGWIFTRSPKRGGGGEVKVEGDDDYVLTAKEIRQMSRFQSSHMGEGGQSKFVTMVLGQNAMGQVEPTAFMASDQCMALERADVFEDSPSPTVMQVREAGAGEVLPQILKGVGSGHDTVATTRFDPVFFIVKVNSGQPVTPPGQLPPKPMFRHSTFPVENRSQFGIKRTPGSVTQQLVEHSQEPLHHRISDFHCLVYLAQLFDEETAEMFCGHVRRDEPLSEGLTLMLEAMMQS